MSTAFASFARSALGARVQSTVDGQAFGGGEFVAGQFWWHKSDVIWNYNAITDEGDSWSDGDDGLPTPVTVKALELLGSVCWVLIEDGTATSSVMYWNAETSLWTAGPALPEEFEVLASVGGTLYALGAAANIYGTTGSAWSLVAAGASSGLVASGGRLRSGQATLAGGTLVEPDATVDGLFDAGDFAAFEAVNPSDDEPGVGVGANSGEVVYFRGMPYPWVTYEMVFPVTGNPSSSASWFAAEGIPFSTVARHWFPDPPASFDLLHVAAIDAAVWYAILSADAGAAATAVANSLAAKMVRISPLSANVAAPTTPEDEIGDKYITVESPLEVGGDMLYSAGSIYQRQVQEVALRQRMRGIITSVDATPANNTYTITIGAASVSVVGNTSVSVTTEALYQAALASSAPEFTRYTWFRLGALGWIDAEYGADGGDDPPTNMELSETGAGTGTVTDFGAVISDYRVRSPIASGVVAVSWAGSLPATATALANAMNASGSTDFNGVTWSTDGAIVRGTVDKHGADFSLYTVETSDDGSFWEAPPSTVLWTGTFAATTAGIVPGVHEFTPSTETWRTLFVAPGFIGAASDLRVAPA